MHMWPKGSVLVDQNFTALRCGDNPCIKASEEDVRPSSLDMPISNRIWQVSGIPAMANGFDFESFISEYSLNDLSGQVHPVTLTPNNTYLAELEPEFALPPTVSGMVNAKSSAGRTDLFCTVLANGSTEFNVIPPGYHGKLYMILVPQSFSLREVVGHDFVQLRLFEGDRVYLTGFELFNLDRQCKLVRNFESPVLTSQGLMLHLDLKSFTPDFLVAIRNGKPISVRYVDNDPEFYFRRKQKDSQGKLFLEPGEFLLASTIEELQIPDHVCAEMVPYHERQGELRSHYAGFFDPGFRGTIVCEIRNIGPAPIILSHGQPIAEVRYEGLRARPESLYGAQKEGSKPSNYQGQTGIRLAKYFRPWPV